MPTPIPNEILQSKVLGPSNDFFAINPATGQYERIYTHPKAATQAPGLTQDILDGGYGSISAFNRQTEEAQAPQFDYFFESDIPAGAPKTYHGEDSRSKGYVPYNTPTAGVNATENVGNLAYLATSLALGGAAGGGTYGGDAAAGAGTGADAMLLADAGTTLTDVGAGYGTATGTTAGTTTAGTTAAGTTAGTQTALTLKDVLAGVSAATGAAGVLGSGSSSDGGTTTTTADTNYGDSPEYSTGSGTTGTGASEDFGMTGNEGNTDPGLWEQLKKLYANKDLMKVIGNVAGTGLGVAGARSRQNQLDSLAEGRVAMGAPYRDRLAATYDDPTAWLNSPEVQAPVQQGTNALSRALSVQGNPYGNPRAQQEITNYASNSLFSRLGTERERLAGFGGLTSFTTAGVPTENARVGASGSVYDAIGSGVADITNPQPSLSEILRQIMKNNQTSGSASLA